MVSRAKSENYSYKSKVTMDVLIEFIDIRMINNDQIISAYSGDGTGEAEEIIEACKMENEKLQLFRTAVSEGKNSDEAFSLWQYYWEELLCEAAPSYFIQ